jgi:hypothetical protein
VRAILESEGLDRALADMGASMARSMVEIFADLPDGHPLFERFSFFAADERAFFEDFVARQGERRRGAEGLRERERVTSLALRYCESRHRLGLLGADVEARVVAARKGFAARLPASLKAAIEFYDPDRVCAAASLENNLLFGRIAQDRAGAEAVVHRIARRVLAERDLNREVIRIGLDAPLDERGAEIGPGDRALIDLARCLVRKPDVLVLARPLETGSAGAEALVGRLRRALEGRALFVVLPGEAVGSGDSPFDVVVRFERGAAVAEQRLAVAEPAEA